MIFKERMMMFYTNNNLTDRPFHTMRYYFFIYKTHQLNGMKMEKKFYVLNVKGLGKISQRFKWQTILINVNYFFTIYKRTNEGNYQKYFNF